MDKQAGYLLNILDVSGTLPRTLHVLYDFILQTIL